VACVVALVFVCEDALHEPSDMGTDDLSALEDHAIPGDLIVFAVEEVFTSVALRGEYVPP